MAGWEVGRRHEHRPLQAVHSLGRGPSGRGPKALTGCEVIKRPWPPPWGSFSLALLDQMLWEKPVSETEASFLSLDY